MTEPAAFRQAPIGLNGDGLPSTPVQRVSSAARRRAVDRGGVLIAISSERPRNVADVTRKVILPAVLDLVLGSPWGEEAQ